MRDVEYFFVILIAQFLLDIFVYACSHQRGRPNGDIDIVERNNGMETDLFSSERSKFFSEIAERLKPNGILASSDLACQAVGY